MAETQTKAGRLSPVREVQNEIRNLERLADAMLAGGGQMLANMMKVSVIADVNPLAGQRAIRATLRLLDGMATVREQNFEAHEELRTTIGTVDLRTFGFGDYTTCPAFAEAAEQPPVATSQPARLHAVA